MPHLGKSEEDEYDQLWIIVKNIQGQISPRFLDKDISWMRDRMKYLGDKNYHMQKRDEFYSTLGM